MPKEDFYRPEAVDGDGTPPDLTVTWGNQDLRVKVNGVAYDRSGINRLIRALKRGRDATYGADE